MSCSSRCRPTQKGDARGPPQIRSDRPWRGRPDGQGTSYSAKEFLSRKELLPSLGKTYMADASDRMPTARDAIVLVFPGGAGLLGILLAGLHRAEARASDTRAPDWGKAIACDTSSEVTPVDRTVVDVGRSPNTVTRGPARRWRRAPGGRNVRGPSTGLLIAERATPSEGRGRPCRALQGRRGRDAAPLRARGLPRPASRDRRSGPCPDFSTGLSTRPGLDSGDIQSAERQQDDGGEAQEGRGEQ